MVDETSQGEPPAKAAVPEAGQEGGAKGLTELEAAGAAAPEQGPSGTQEAGCSPTPPQPANPSSLNTSTNSSSNQSSRAGNTTAPTSEEEPMDFEDSDGEDDEDGEAEAEGDGDEDDEDGDAKSNHSSSNHSSTTNSNTSHRQRGRKAQHGGEGKRRHHNVLERKRRDLIKDEFSKLRQTVPTLTSERASRAQILKKAADFIQLTQKRNEAFRAELKELVDKNAELERKANAKEKSLNRMCNNNNNNTNT